MQGFILYFSAKSESAVRILRAVKPVLDKYRSDIHNQYEITASSDYLNYINNGDLEQKGKFITINTANEEDAVKLALELDKVLIYFSSDDFIEIPAVHSLGNSGGLYTRYGSYYPGGSRH